MSPVEKELDAWVAGSCDDEDDLLVEADLATAALEGVVSTTVKSRLVSNPGTPASLRDGNLPFMEYVEDVAETPVFASGSQPQNSAKSLLEDPEE